MLVPKTSSKFKLEKYDEKIFKNCNKMIQGNVVQVSNWLMGLLFLDWRGQSETFSQNEEEDEEETFDKQSLRDYFSWKNKWTILNHIKIAVLLIITSVCCVSMDGNLCWTLRYGNFLFKWFLYYFLFAIVWIAGNTLQLISSDIF